MSPSKRLAIARKVQTTVISLIICAFVIQIMISLPTCYEHLEDIPLVSSNSNTTSVDHNGTLQYPEHKHDEDTISTTEGQDYYEEVPDIHFFKFCQHRYRLLSKENCICVYDEQLDVLDSKIENTVISILDKVNLSTFMDEVVIKSQCVTDPETLWREYDFQMNIQHLLKTSIFQHKYICFDFISRTEHLMLWVCRTFENDGSIEKLNNGSTEERFDGSREEVNYDSTETQNDGSTESGWETLETNVNRFCSILSLLADFGTILVYLSLRELQTLQGKILTSYLISMATFNSIPITKDIIFEFLPMEYQSIQNNLTIFSDFFFLGWRSWLTVMCYDMWYNFSHPLQLTTGSLGQKRFLIYSLVAWGWPVVQIIVFKLPQIYDIPFQCDFMYKNILLAVILTLVMFIFTLFNLVFHHTARFNSNDFRRHGVHQDRMFIYVRLAVLMGIDWFLLVVCHRLAILVFYRVAYVLLQSQGMILFIILVYNKRVVRLLHTKCCSNM